MRFQNGVHHVDVYSLCLRTCMYLDRQTALIGDLMQRWDVYISIKAKKQPIQSVIIKSIEQNMECVYEARRRILEFSSQPVRSLETTGTSFQGIVTNGKAGDLESSVESGFTSSMGGLTSSTIEVTSANRPVQIPTSFSEDKIAIKAGFTSSGTYTTLGGGGQGGGGNTGFAGGATVKRTRGGKGEAGRGDQPTPEITVDESGIYVLHIRVCMNTLHVYMYMCITYTGSIQKNDSTVGVVSCIA